MKVGVVGHVEWVEFLRVPVVPVAGEIVHASRVWAEAAGGGSVAAVQLRKLAGSALFLTALGDDDLGRLAADDLRTRGVQVEATLRPEPQRRAVTFVDDGGERTITVLGDRLVPARSDPLPWDELASCDAVYFTGGDVEAVRAAREAKVLVATSRALPVLAESGVELDALVGSARDPGERYRPGDLAVVPRHVVMTAGAGGGSWRKGGDEEVSYAAEEIPGAVGDAYGCGDSFAAGLAYGLGAGMGIKEAVRLAARCGAACLAGSGAYEGQLESAA